MTFDLTPDLAHFTPWAALAGGLLIGLAAAGLMLFNGRIAGISGILGGVLHWPRGDVGWRVAFLSGLSEANSCAFPLAPCALYRAP